MPFIPRPGDVPMDTPGSSSSPIPATSAGLPQGFTPRAGDALLSDEAPSSEPALAGTPIDQNSPGALRQQMSSDPYFLPTDAQWEVLRKDDEGAGFLGRRAREAKGFVAGVKELPNLVGEAHKEMKDVPFDLHNGRRTLNTLLEGGARLGMFVRNVVPEMADKGKNFVEDFVTNEASRAQRYREHGMMLRRDNLRARGLPEQKPENFDASKPSYVLPQNIIGDAPPFDKASDVVSMTLPLPGMGQVGKVMKLVPGAAKVGELAERLPGVAQLAGAVEKTGEAVKTAAQWPSEKMAELATKLPLPEGIKKGVEGITHLAGVGSIAAAATGHGGLPAKVGAGIKAAELAGAFAEETGAFARRVAEADANSIPRLVQVSKNADAPQWVRSLASSLHDMGAGKAAQFAGDVGKSAATGAAHGYVLGQATGQEPEEVGKFAGIGAGMGAGGRLLGKAMGQDAKMREALRNQNFYEYVTRPVEKGGLGLSQEQAVRVDDFTRLTVGAAHAIDPNLKFRFIEPGEFKAEQGEQGQAGAAASYDPASHTITLRLGDESKRVAHELPHAISRALGADAETRELIRSQLSPEQVEVARKEYAQKLVDAEVRQRGPSSNIQPEDYARLIDAKVNELDSSSHLGPDWVYAEMAADAGAGVLQHTSLGKITGQNDTVWSRIANKKRAQLLNAFGIEADADRSRPNPMPEGNLFSDPAIYANPELRRLIYQQVRQLYRGQTGAAQGVKIMRGMWGKFKGAPLKDLGDGTKGNDFVVQTPGGEIVNRKPFQTQRIVRSRRAEMNQIFPVTTPLPSNDVTPEVRTRVTPSGQVERSGTVLGDAFYTSKTFGAESKAMAKAVTNAIANGESLQGWYQQIGEMPEWKASVRRDTGAVEAQFKEFVPINFHVDKQGNVLVRNYSLSAFDRKAARWSGKNGEVSLDLWGGDIGSFKRDVQTYLKNHVEGRPGAEVIGDQKRDVINAFLVGGNRTFETKNNLRARLHGEDRAGIVRSYRLDRLETLEPSEREFGKPQYEKQVRNLSPEVTPGIQHSPIPNLPKEMFRDTEQRGWVDYANQRAAFRRNGRPEAETAEQKELGIVLDAKKARAAGAVRDPLTGVPTFMQEGKANDYEAHRESIRTRAVYQVAREAMQVYLRKQFPDKFKDLSSEELDHLLAKHASGEKETREAAAMVTTALKESDEAAHKLAGMISPEFVAAVTKLKQLVPIVDFPSAPALLDKKGFRVIAEGSEGAIIGRSNGDYVYKLFKVSRGAKEHRGFLLSEIKDQNPARAKEPGSEGYLLQIGFGNLVDTINKMERQSRLEGGLPSEIQGITEKGELIIKMPRMERIATGQEGADWVSRHTYAGAPTQTTLEKGSIVIPEAGRNQPVLTDQNGNHYAAGDVRYSEYAGGYPNLMVDKQGRIFATDILTRPIDEADLKDNYDLREFTPEQPDKILYSPEVPDNLMKWFGNSKVVDEEGKPLQVFHGTQRDIESFNTRRNKVANRLGAYFTDNPEAAGERAMLIQNGARVMPVYLKMEKPVDLRNVRREDLAKALGFNDKVQREMQIQGRAGAYTTLEFLDGKYDLVPTLKRRGVDGLIFDGGNEGNTYVVFDPRQVKSASGNRGTFDASDPRIQFSPEAGKEAELGIGNDESAALKEKRRLTRREALQVGRKFPESVPVMLDAKGEPKKVGYGLVDSDLVTRHGDAKAALFLGTRLAREAKKSLSNPAIADAVGWYSRFREAIRKTFGANAVMLSELLAATSARTGVRDNFAIAKEALEKYGRGDYDDLLSRFAQHLKQGGKENDFAEVPLKENGQKFNANSKQVRRVLFGNWAEKAGLKTAAFAENLSSENAPATIDVWAARTLRRMLYQGETKRWRILPMQEKGVQDKDFLFGQRAMGEAAKRLNMDPEDLQALLWFGEKDLWEKNKWTRGAGAEKSSFNQEFSKLLGNEQPGDLPGTGSPVEPVRFQAGVTDYTTAEKFNKASHNKEGAQLRKELGKLPGLMALRVKDTMGIYGTPEPSWDVEGTTREAKGADVAERVVYEKGKQHEQSDVFFSRVVDANHPNARPGVEVLFKQPMTVEELQSSILPKLTELGIDGMTPAMDQAGRVIGFRTQFVPEISARWAGEGAKALLDPVQFRRLAEQWFEAKATRLLDWLDPKLVRYKQPGFYDTRVFGKEETSYPERPAQTSLTSELGRRARVLDAAAPGH